MAINQQEEDRKRQQKTGAIPESGRWTYDLTDAQETAKFHNVGYQSAVDAQGRPGYVIESTKPHRQSIPGTAGADEGLLNDNDYYHLQQLKQQFAAEQANQKAAQASGDTAAADAAWQRMNSLHDQAENIRAGYEYSGGYNGGAYIPIGKDHGAGQEDSGYGSGYGSGGGDLSGGVEDYSAYLEQMNAALKAAALAELKAAYDKNVAALDRAGQAIPGQYQAARNQSAGESEQAKRNFAQYAAANGLNNGTSGQAQLARSIALQGDLNTLNGAEADALADLELQRANAEIEYNNAIAQAEATGDYQLAADLYQEKVRVQEALTELHLQQQKFALQQYQLQYQARQDAIANQLAQDKFDFQKQQYADELALQQAKQADKTNGGSTGSSNGKYSNGSLTYTQVRQLQAALGLPKTGYYDAATKEAAEGLGANNAYKQIIQGAQVMGDAHFKQAMTAIMGHVNAGRSAQAEAALDQIWHRLTDEQKSRAGSALHQAGVAYWQQ